jgi:ATP-dependent Clp protease ATP-binding subunit ClpX
LEDVELDVTPEALTAIARRAIKRRTGARGLRSIMEQSLLGTMYELPSRRDINRVILEKEAVEGQGTPTLVKGPRPDRQAAEEKSLRSAAA